MIGVTTMNALLSVVAAVSADDAPTPTPTPLPFNPDDVTPGVIGFFVIFALFVAVGLITFDLIRRVRRAQARMVVREQLEAELAEREGADGAAAGGAKADGGADRGGAGRARGGSAGR